MKILELDTQQVQKQQRLDPHLELYNEACQ